MNSAPEIRADPLTGALRAVDILIVAAWFGLATGLLEGILRIVLQSLDGVSWDLLLIAASLKLIWVAPLIYVVLFSMGGAALALAGRFAPRLPMARNAMFLFGLMCFMDLVSSSGRVRSWGVGMLALGLAVAVTRKFSAHQKTAILMFRRSVVWLAAVALLAFAGIESGLRMQESEAIAALPPAAPGAPNVLLIVVDTLRADHLSLLGYSRKTSPNLEKIATQSVVFENVFATSSWTLPSHASILTGLYPSEHGAERFGLPRRNVTLAKVLQARGYLTGAFSANTLLFSRAFGFGPGFIRFEDSFQNLGDMAIRTNWGRWIQKYVLRRLGFENQPGRKLAADVNRSLLRWLDGERKRPFFAVLNYFDVHDPYVPSQPFRGRFSKRPNPGGLFNTYVGRDSSYVSTPEILEDEVAAYDGAIAYVDDQLGALSDELERRGLSQNTILIITSDHGESFWEHGVFEHGTSLYAEQVRVPLLIRWPGKVPAGMRIPFPVSLVELASTVMDLLDGGNPENFRGPSLVRTWTDPKALDDWPYSAAQLAAAPQLKNPKLLPYSGAMEAMVSPKWYFIVHEKFGPQLFDRELDPAQMNNLAGTPEGQRVVADFESRLREIRRHPAGPADKHP